MIPYMAQLVSYTANTKWIIIIRCEVLTTASTGTTGTTAITSTPGTTATTATTGATGITSAMATSQLVHMTCLAFVCLLFAVYGTTCAIYVIVMLPVHPTDNRSDQSVQERKSLGSSL